MSCDPKSDPNLLIISDVHLGRDVLEGMGVGLVRRVARVDRELIGFLEHYTRNRVAGRPWRLIVAGDMIEFVGMAVQPSAAILTPPTDEERQYGLGSAPDHVLLKLARVFDRHALVMERLAEFVGCGNSLVVLRGNHDVELFWDEVQADFRERLVSLAGVQDGAAAAFRERVSFVPWFYYEPGLVYVEHGHQYDGLCSFDFQLYPVDPENPQRIVDDVSMMALRYLVNPTPRLPREASERWSSLDYLKWIRAIGAGEFLRFAGRYAQMTLRIVRLWRRWGGKKLQALREEHQRRMRALPFASAVGEATLRTIDALKSVPMTGSLFRLMRAVFLDRFALGLAVLVAILTTLLAGPPYWVTVLVAAASVALAAGALVWSARGRVIDATPSLRRAALQLARRLNARYIVMGHTHQPMAESLGDQRWYYNVGNWTDEELSGVTATGAAMTHLVIEHRSDATSAELMSWSSTECSPRRFLV